MNQKGFVGVIVVVIGVIILAGVAYYFIVNKLSLTGYSPGIIVVFWDNEMIPYEKVKNIVTDQKLVFNEPEEVFSTATALLENPENLYKVQIVERLKTNNEIGTVYTTEGFNNEAILYFYVHVSFKKLIDKYTAEKIFSSYGLTLYRFSHRGYFRLQVPANTESYYRFYFNRIPGITAQFVKPPSVWCDHCGQLQPWYGKLLQFLLQLGR